MGAGVFSQPILWQTRVDRALWVVTFCLCMRPIPWWPVLPMLPLAGSDGQQQNRIFVFKFGLDSQQKCKERNSYSMSYAHCLTLTRQPSSFPCSQSPTTVQKQLTQSVSPASVSAQFVTQGLHMAIAAATPFDCSLLLPCSSTLKLLPEVSSQKDPQSEG